MRVTALLLGSVAASAAFVSVAGAAMTHRYSFNDGTANDSVAGANGTLVNGATVSGGLLRFDPAVNNGGNNPAAGQYVSLPINVLKTSTFSIEAWATTNSATAWQRIIDLGNTNGNGFMILTPFNNQGNPLGQVSIASSGQPGDTNYVAGTGTPVQTGQEDMYAYVHNYVTGFGALYVNGVMVGSAAATVNPATTQYANYWIGRSNFSADPYWDGTMDELRTYNNALTAVQVAADYAAGPNGVPEPATAAVLAPAAVALAAGRRRRR